MTELLPVEIFLVVLNFMNFKEQISILCHLSCKNKYFYKNKEIDKTFWKNMLFTIYLIDYTFKELEYFNKIEIFGYQNLFSKINYYLKTKQIKMYNKKDKKKEEEEKWNVVMLGTDNVGKSSLVTKFAEKYGMRYSLKDEFISFQTLVDHKFCKLFCYDNYKHFDEIKHLWDNFLFNGQAFILVCAVNDKYSFQWLQEFIIGLCRVFDSIDIPIVVCLCKSDLLKEELCVVTKEMVDQKLEEIVKKGYLREIPPVFVSNLNEINYLIDFIFEYLVRRCRLRKIDIVKVVTDILEGKNSIEFVNEKKKCLIM
ncbi:hypothetical protein ABK040_008015 [Willaertia magna]